MSETAAASAPATSGNLGPGFDCLGLAIGLRCTVEARIADDWSVKYHGENRPAPGRGSKPLVAAHFAVGERPLAMEVYNDIPFGKGLGSSAAAFVAGAAAALRAVGEDAVPDRVYRIAMELEGHPDQVAAAVYGGLTLIPAEGLPHRIPIHPSLRPVIAVPESQLPTMEARAVVDHTFRRDVVVRSLARVTALTTGLITGDPEMLSAAHGDEIHEEPRAKISPEVSELIDVAKSAGALHAARSGAGPSVLALTTVETTDRVVRAFKEFGVEALTPSVEPTGLI